MEAEDYKGEHEAPDKENGAPLYNLSGIYPDDFYTGNAIQYGDKSSRLDHEALSIMLSAKNRPSKPIKIYRAVPKTISNEEKIIGLENQKRYIQKYGKVPPNINTKLDRSRYYEFLNSEIEKLKLLPPTPPEEKIKINPGDWVTITRGYAVEHGRDNLRNQYRIISKVVPAKHLFTDGNSFTEWGYDPS